MRGVRPSQMRSPANHDGLVAKRPSAAPGLFPGRRNLADIVTASGDCLGASALCRLQPADHAGPLPGSALTHSAIVTATLASGPRAASAVSSADARSAGCACVHESSGCAVSSTHADAGAQTGMLPWRAAADCGESGICRARHQLVVLTQVQVLFDARAQLQAERPSF